MSKEGLTEVPDDIATEEEGAPGDIAASAGDDTRKRSADESKAAIGEGDTENLKETLGGDVDFTGTSESAVAELIKPDPEKV